MKSKKIISGLLALTFVLGGAAIPGAVVDNSVVASAAEVLTYGDYEYTLLEDGTVEIARYIGSDTEVEIPGEINGAAVTSIGNSAFSGNKNITNVTMPEGISNIGFRAFFDCDALLEMAILDGVKTIGGMAFNNCEKLRKVTMTDSVEYLGVGALCAGVFGGCTDLENVTLSNKLTKINSQTFQSCTKLKEIKLPSGIKSIGEKAFLSCTNLENINLPDGLETINGEAFKKCDKLVSISIPDSVTSISNNNFYDCASLTNVKLSANLTSLGGSSFTRCPSLKELEVPASIKSIASNSGLFLLNYKSENENKEPSFTLNCYNRSSAEKYALENAINFKIIDAEDKTEYPELTEAQFAKIKNKDATYCQFRLKWTEVEGAQQYGIAVNLAGKWKVQAYTDAKTTTFTSPKLKSSPNNKYEMAICAKVNGKWEITNFTKRSFTITTRTY